MFAPKKKPGNPSTTIPRSVASPGTPKAPGHFAPHPARSPSPSKSHNTRKSNIGVATTLPAEDSTPRAPTSRSRSRASSPTKSASTRVTRSSIRLLDSPSRRAGSDSPGLTPAVGSQDGERPPSETHAAAHALDSSNAPFEHIAPGAHVAIQAQDFLNVGLDAVPSPSQAHSQVFLSQTLRSHLLLRILEETLTLSISLRRQTLILLRLSCPRQIIPLRVRRMKLQSYQQ